MDGKYEGIERRMTIQLSEEQLEEIAERAAEKAIIKMETKLYTEVGRTFVSKLLKMVGLGIVALALYLNKDLVKIL